MRPRKFFSVCLLCSTLSTLFIVIGLVLLFIWPILMKYLIDSNVVLTKNSHTFEIWRKFPEKFPIDFYFFNWTNPEDVYNVTVKARFKEMGPYKFLETKEKSDIVWNDNGTVTFRHLKFWYDNEEDQVHDIREQVTTINPVTLSAVYVSRNWNPLIRKSLSVPLSAMSPTLHITRSISEMLFEGYKDPMISIGKTLPFISDSLPSWDKFGWFYTRNGSSKYEGIFNMGTGINSTFGKLYSWNNWIQTPYFEEDCAKINGSAGEFFVDADETSISFFSPDLCRTMTLRYSEKSMVKNILGNKYVVDEYMLDNGTLYPENNCFCNGECVPSGAINVSSCRYGSPSFASLPHFYQSDPYYIETIEGLNPEKNKHEFYIIIEPTTGIPLEVSARLQINMLMQPVSGISMFERVPKIFIPMFWFEQKVRIPESEAFQLRVLLNLPVICTSLGIVLVFIGFIVLSCFVYKICTMNVCKREEKYSSAEQRIPLKENQPVQIVKKL